MVSAKVLPENPVSVLKNKTLHPECNLAAPRAVHFHPYTEAELATVVGLPVNVSSACTGRLLVRRRQHVLHYTVDRSQFHAGLLIFFRATPFRSPGRCAQPKPLADVVSHKHVERIPHYGRRVRASAGAQLLLTRGALLICLRAAYTYVGLA